MKDETIIEWLGGLAESGKKIDYTLHEDDVEMLEEAVKRMKVLKSQLEGIKMNEDITKIHPDYAWAREIANGRSCGFETYGPNEPLKVLFMYKKNKIQVFMLNVVLYFKWFRREFGNGKKKKNN